jgi:hypothetical protein
MGVLDLGFVAVRCEADWRPPQAGSGALEEAEAEEEIPQAPVQRLPVIRMNAAPSPGFGVDGGDALVRSGA